MVANKGLLGYLEAIYESVKSQLKTLPTHELSMDARVKPGENDAKIQNVGIKILPRLNTSQRTRIQIKLLWRNLKQLLVHPVP